jgi:hypothetical protein
MEDKRYLVFGFYSYYPSGGIDDKVSSFDLLEDAEYFVEKNELQYENYNIYDRLNGKKIII